MVHLVVGILTTFYLVRNLLRSKIPGHNKEKIFWFITTLFVLIYYSSFFLDIANLIFNFSWVYNYHILNLRAIEGSLYFITHLLNIFLSFILFYSGIGLLRRDERGRKIVVSSILYSAPLTAIQIYFHSKTNEEENGLYYGLTGLIISLIIFGIVRYLLTRNFMISFFVSPE